MRNHRWEYFAIVIAASLALAAELAFGATNIGVRIGFLATSLLLTGLAFFLIQKRTAHSFQELQQSIDRLCQLDPYELADCNRSQLLSALPMDSRWQKIYQQIGDYLVSCSKRIQDAESARISAEVRARRIANQSEQAKEILHGLADPIVAIDHYDELLLANPQAEELFEIDTENTSDRALSQLIHCEKLVEILTETRQHRATTQRSDEIEIVDSQGEKHWFSAHVRNISIAGEPGNNENQGNRGAVAVLQDIGTQKAIQKRNAEFVSSVSHEMKTPLAGIKAYVELLVDGEAEDESTREEFLEVINSQADRLQRLIDNLLNLARIEAGVVEVNKKPLALNEVLEEAFSIVQPAAEQKEIQLSKDLSPLYLGVLVDRDMILQSTINLLSNAIKYTPNEGSVVLHSRLIDEEIQIEVEDSGVGLSEEDCEKIFEKFYRVKKDHKMAPGTGLGLSLAKHIVEDVHSGRLTVTSQIGQGSKFQIMLPKSDPINS